jgi:crotonobetaine/carnitine-CoA ligase
MTTFASAPEGTTIRTLAGWLNHWARLKPGQTFMTWQGICITYGEADRLVRIAAASLAELDRMHGATGRIVLFSQNCPAAIIVWLAAQAAGLVPVTLNRAQRGAILADVVHRSNPSVIVCDPEGVAILNESTGAGTLRIVTIGTAAVEELGELGREGQGEIDVPLRLDPARDGTIMFSSGTTGRSKGVVIPHGMFDAGPRQLQDAWRVTEADVFHCWAPWFHIAAQLDVFALALRSGASVALFPGFSLSRFWGQVRESGATVFGGFVSILEMLYAQEPGQRDRDHRLRFGIAGHIPAALRNSFQERFGVTMLDTYGMSEAEPLTIPRLGRHIPDGSCGPANPDFRIEIQDGEGRACPTGEEGEIVFRPLCDHVMMSGYLDEPERSRAAWRNRWFLTGDLGTMDSEGNVFFRDRKSEFIRVKGENVSPQEVESVLMGHPDIAEVAVVGVPSELGEHEILAIVVPRGALSGPDVQEWCSSRMAKFMIPRHIRVVAELPRTPTSKVQRSELRRLLEDSAPEG